MTALITRSYASVLLPMAQDSSRRRILRVVFLLVVLAADLVNNVVTECEIAEGSGLTWRFEFRLIVCDNSPDLLRYLQMIGIGFSIY
jgi:hypothetical protein